MAGQAHSITHVPGITIDPAVEVAAARLAGATGAEAVILFGSRARGDGDAESDWDLCVVLPDDLEWGRFTSVSLWPLVSDLGIPIHIAPIRRSVFKAKKNGINNLSHDVARDGIVVYGSLNGLPTR